MVTQPTFFDQVEKKKHEGIELVYRHADTKWKESAADMLMEIAKEKMLFTSEDILMGLEKIGIVTGDNRAVSAVMLAASRMHLIRSTDRFKTSVRRSRHHAPIRVWESMIYGN